jgi:HK97 family phage portal protein
MAVFESLGRLNDWAQARGIELVDPGVSLLSYDADSTSEKGYRSPPVRTVVDFIARHVSAMPLKVYRKNPDGSRERVTDGPLADLIANPTRGPLGPMRFWYALISDGLLTDRMLATLEADDRGFFLRRIPGRRWQVKADAFDEITGVRIFVDPENTRDLKAGQDPFLIDVGYATSGAKGSSQLRTLKRVLAEYGSSMDYREQVNKNGLRTPLAILREKPWPDKESRDRFGRGMREFMAGGSSAGGGLLLEDNMKPQELGGFKPIDVADLDARTQVKIDVANAYGIPAELMGLRQGNFSNMQAFLTALYGVYLKPYSGALEGALNRCLVDAVQPGDGLYVEFDLDAQMRGNPELQYESMVKVTGRPVFTTNEIRSRINMPPIDGGDDLVTPLNVLLGGQTSPEDGETGGRGGGSLDDLHDEGTTTTEASRSVMSPDDMAKAANSVGILIRSGFDPDESREAVGIPPIRHTGLLPVTLRDESEAEADVRQAQAKADEAENTDTQDEKGADGAQEDV